MKKENKTAASILRQKAEVKLKKQQVKPGTPATEADMVKLIHELQVHQIELELQNEELILANERAMAATEKYTELYDFAPSGYFTLNKAGKIIELNLQGAKMLGKDRSSLLNSRFGFFIKEDSRNVFNTFLDEIFHGKNNAVCEVPLISNGNITLHVHLTGIISENQEQCRVTITDITERKKAEDDLKQNLVKYQVLIDTFPIGITISDKAGNIIETNEKALELLGLSRDEHLKRKLKGEEWKIIKTDGSIFPQDEYASVKALKENRLVENVEMGIVKSGEEVTWINVTAAPIPIKELGVVIAYNDITERKKILEYLEKYKNIVSSSPDGIAFLDKNYRYIVINDAYEKFSGMSREILNGMTVSDYLGEDVFQRIVKPNLDKCLDGNVINYQEWFNYPTLGKRFVDITYFPYWDNHNNIVGVISNTRDITELKQTENALRENEERLKLALKATNDVVWDWDIVNDTQRWNEAGMKVFGWTEIVENTVNAAWWAERIHPDDRQKVEKEFYAVVKNTSAKKWQDEYRFLKADGTYAEVLDRGYVLRDNQGKAIRMIGAMMDITERKNAEKALKESELFANTIANTTPALLYLYDFEQAKNIWTNEAHKCFFEDMKKDSSSFNYDEISQFTHPDDFRELLRLVDEMFNNHNINHYETEHRLKWKGTWKWMKLFVSVFKRDLEGKPVQILGALFDIDDIKKAEQHLFEAKEKAENSKRLLAKIAENYPNSFISLIEKDLTISFSGGQEFKRQNLNPDDYDGMTVEQVFGEKAPIVKANYLKTFQGEETTFELFIRNQYQLYKTVPLNDENNKISRILVVVENITDRKKAEEELIKAKEKAEESDRLKSAFLANMSHEIRTPMNGILGFAELLKEPALSGEQQARYIGIIEKSGARMLNTINDIIDFSKIEAGLMEVTISETNINSQFDDIYNFFKPETDARGLTLTCNKTLPDDEVNINTDAQKLYAIFTNLVKNAIKFTPKGSVEFGYKIVETLHATSQPLPATSLQFYVKDTGIGIPQNRLEAVFDRFIQADVGDKRAFQGSGLGLTISKAYVEMLGGKIWVESHEENPETGLAGGTTFYFIIPLVFGHEQNRNPENNQADMPAEFDSFPDDLALKILIVEDEEDSNAMLAAFLQNISREILIAKTGFEAIELCRNHPDLDLVLMDMKMPDMNGYEATRTIRTFNREVVIVAQTAYALYGDREKSLEAGCDDYITKPIKKSILFEKLKKFGFDEEKHLRL